MPRELAVKPSRHPAGYSKITATRLDILKRCLMAGMTRDLTAKAMGIAPGTLQTWFARADDDPDGPYGEVRRVGLEAEAECARQALEVIKNAAVRDGKWQAAAWLLERRYGYRAQADLHIDGKVEVTCWADMAIRGSGEVVEAEYREVEPPPPQGALTEAETEALPPGPKRKG